MLKLEIRLNEEKICEEGKYAPDYLNRTLIKAFEKRRMKKYDFIRLTKGELYD